jgi:hypothetical protein
MHSSCVKNFFLFDVAWLSRRFIPVVEALFFAMSSEPRFWRVQ